MGQNEVPEGIATKMLSNFEKRHGALSSAPSGDAQIDAQNRAKAAGFKFVQEDKKIDEAHRAILARLATELRDQQDDPEGDDPEVDEPDEFEEFNTSLRDMNVVGWTDNKIFTSESGGSESCAYDYCRDSDGAIEIDRSSRTVV